MKKRFYDIENEITYFRKVVKNMDIDDIRKEKKHLDNDVHFSEFLFDNSSVFFETETDRKYRGILQWIDLIQNEKLYKAIEYLTDEEKYFISLLFYENKTQDELAEIYHINQSSVFYKINKILRKIKNYMLKNKI